MKATNRNSSVVLNKTFTPLEKVLVLDCSVVVGGCNDLNKVG